jgi:3-(3-hydroxy-phenyl)propionate hydroxylase
VVDSALALGNHRWEFPLEAHESEKDFSTPEQLWPLLKSMGVTPDDVEIHQHAFYKHHVRHAEHWQVGRIFLVGDAAHLMPPWAGQGMQSGVRDAFNLSWKLREVLSGRLPASLLDTYETERAPNVAMITAASERLGRIVKMQMTRKEKMLGLLGRLLLKLGLPPPTPPLGKPSMGAGWLRGPMGAKSAVGRMIPQPHIATARGKVCRLDDVLGQGFALLGNQIEPGIFMSAKAKAGWDALGASYITVRATTEATQLDTDIVDLDGTLIAWLRRYEADAVALRPDRFVAAAHTGSSGDFERPE